MELKRLSDFFSPDKIEFRIGATNEVRDGKNVVQKATHGFALPYVTNRAIQERLDEVCGIENWRNEFLPWQGDSQLCGISIKIDGEWVTKWDGAENTKTEPVKGGLSASMKRAAAQWGIGRYLYDIDPLWVEICPKGKGYKFKYAPTLPQEFLPTGTENAGYIAPVASKEELEIAKLAQDKAKSKIDEKMGNALVEVILANNIDMTKVLKWAKIKELNEMTVEQFNALMDIYAEKLTDFKRPVIDVSDDEKRKLDALNAKMGAKT